MPRLRLENILTPAEELRVSTRLGDPSVGAVPVDQWPRAWSEVVFKELAQLPLRALPEPAPAPSLPGMRRHKSSRSFGRGEVTQAQLSALLEGVSINRNEGDTGLARSRRTYPSAGARYPLDAYLLILRSAGLAPGAYLHDPRTSSLQLVGPGATPDEVAAIFGEPWTADASLVIFLVAHWFRSEMKYGDRGLGYAYIEAGHMAQNLILLAHELGLSACPVGGFWEDRVERLFRLVTPEEAPVYAVVLGTAQEED